jgi:hypothetical protein
MKQIIEQVKHIADCLSNPELFDSECFEDGEPNALEYLSDTFDIEYIVSGDGSYRGARVLVAFGGPNIWIDTKTNTVEGYWWNDKHFESFTDELGLDAALCELWECR